MKFESIKDELFKGFEANKVNNMNAILGGYKAETNGHTGSIANGKNGDDTYHSDTDSVTDDGHPMQAPGGPGKSKSKF